ncbi:MAG: neutral zinc metallopeptidase [Bacteroidota bacterium]
MRWQQSERSKNVDDRRGQSGGGRRIGGGIGIGAIILALLAFLFGGDPMAVLQNASQSAPTQTQTQPVDLTKRDDYALGEFVKVVLKETEDVWYKLFQEQLNRRYQPPVLVLYDRQTTSACGVGSSATGPFYCPGDQKIYIDLTFYEELQTKFGASGDFAMAYVIAHEVGHHIQYLLDITTQVEQQKRRMSKAQGNELSVRLELQADFLAGVWAHHGQKMKGFLEEGDLEEAVNAAAAVGDDRIQMKSRGYVVPESFTHGTSEQRVRWFKKGLMSGNVEDGDTFRTNAL